MLQGLFRERKEGNVKRRGGCVSDDLQPESQQRQLLQGCSQRQFLLWSWQEAVAKSISRAPRLRENLDGCATGGFFLSRIGVAFLMEGRWRRRISVVGRMNELSWGAKGADEVSQLSFGDRQAFGL